MIDAYNNLKENYIVIIIIISSIKYFFFSVQVIN